MRHMATILLAASGLAAAGEASAFICPRVPLSPFQLADRADEIAIVERRARGFEVERVLKGQGTIWLALPAGDRPVPGPPPPPPPPPRRPRDGRRIIVLEEPSCRRDAIEESIEGRALAFATSDGWSVHPFGTSVVGLPPYSSMSAEEARALVDAIERWLANREPDVRRRLLLGLVARPDRVGTWAAVHFRAAPELLRGMSRAEATTLAIAIDGALDRVEPADALALLDVLARLHLPEALPMILDAYEGPRAAQLRELESQEDFLSWLAGREVPPLVDRAATLAWLAQHMAPSRDALLRAGLASQGRGGVDPGDARALAAVVREGPGRALRRLALDLCEQATGLPIRLDDPAERLWDYPGVGSAVLDGDPQDHRDETWVALAARCERGAP